MKLTAQHVCEVTGWSRDQLRSVLDDLPNYRGRKAEARVARRFSAADLLFFAAVSHLERDVGLRRSAVCRVAVPLREALSRPRTMSWNALFISLHPARVSSIGDSLPDRSGIVVNVSTFARKLHQYFGLHALGSDKQAVLRLRPTLISRRSA